MEHLAWVLVWAVVDTEGTPNESEDHSVQRRRCCDGCFARIRGGEEETGEASRSAGHLRGRRARLPARPGRPARSPAAPLAAAGAIATAPFNPTLVGPVSTLNGPSAARPGDDGDRQRAKDALSVVREGSALNKKFRPRRIPAHAWSAVRLPISSRSRACLHHGVVMAANPRTSPRRGHGARTPVRCASRMAAPPRGGGSSSSSARSAARMSDRRRVRFTPGTSRNHGQDFDRVEIGRPRGQDRPFLDRFEIRVIQHCFGALMMHCGLQQRGEIRRGFVLKCVHGSLIRDVMLRALRWMPDGAQSTTDCRRLSCWR